MIKKTMIRALIGFVIGMAAGEIIAIVMAFLSGRTTLASEEMIARFGSEVMWMLVHTFFSGLHGAICMAGTTLYELEDWGLLKTSMMHCLLILCSFTVIGLYLEWISFSFADIAISWTCMIIGYLIIWLIMDARYKREVKKLNEMLEKDQAGSEKE